MSWGLLGNEVVLHAHVFQHLKNGPISVSGSVDNCGCGVGNEDVLHAHVNT
jgi:hypothetical protein